MAGIEEVSAIITVAELGLKLSGSLAIYATEVKDSPKEIGGLENEIRTTCERLKDISGIVEQNRQVPILSAAGLQSVVRASDESKRVIDDIQFVLRKAECG